MNLIELGQRANAIREAAHGNRTYFAINPSPADELAVPAGADPEPYILALKPQSAVEPRIIPSEGQTTGEAEIRLIALARLAYPPHIHIRANWTHLTDAIAQVALRFGADELTGFPPDLDHREITRAITEAGRDPYPCDPQYNPTPLPAPQPKLQVLPAHEP